MKIDSCNNCGADALLIRLVRFDVEHAGVMLSVEDQQSFCSSCGSVSYVGDQISLHERTVAQAIRSADGLLSADELRNVRLKYKLKQSDMEQMLATGQKTWTRWERGKIPQSKAVDKLIRLIAEDASIANRLMEQSGVVNLEAAAVFSEIEQSAKRSARDVIRAEMSSLHSCDLDELIARATDFAFNSVGPSHRRASVEVKVA